MRGDEGDHGDRSSRDRDDPRRAGQVVHRAKNRPNADRNAAGQTAYWNVTGNVSVLFALFFSPGTGAIVAVTV